MSYEDKYNDCWVINKEGKGVDKRKDKAAAIKDLQAADQSEVFKLIGYFEGGFYFENEELTRSIEFSWNCTAGVEIMNYMTIRDLLRISAPRGYVVITTLKDWE